MAASAGLPVDASLPRTCERHGAPFHRIFPVHCIYFWSEVGTVLAKLAAALRPGGKLVLAFRPEGEDMPNRFRDAIYRFPRIDELRIAVARVGLVVEQLAPSEVAPSVVLLTASREA